MSSLLKVGSSKMQEKELNSKLGKMSLHAKTGDCLRPWILRRGIEVEKAKIEVIPKLPPPKCIKDIRSFLGHAWLYRRFIKDFSKIARPLTKLLANDVPFDFDDGCSKLWEKLKKELYLHLSFLLLTGPNHLRSVWCLRPCHRCYPRTAYR